MFERPADLLLGWWLVWVGQALWCWYNVNLFLRRGRRKIERPARPRSPEHPAAVIVPLKGADAGLIEHIDRLRHQRYPSYRLIFAVESPDDPAHALVRRVIDADGGAAGLTGIDLVVAGLAEDQGQKVHNQQAALATVGQGQSIVVFADADAAPDADWLMHLVRPLYKGEVGVTTGYRWLVPSDDRLASRVASVINAGVATLMGPDRRNFAWGGSMAAKRTTLEQIDLAGHWDGALSDDYQMTRAAARAKLRVYFVVQCLVPSPVSLSWGQLLRWGRRQYLITRVHAPVIWAVGLAATLLYVGGWATAIGAVLAGAWGHVAGWGWAIAAAAVVTLADTQRGRLRGRIAAMVLDEKTHARLASARRLDRWATPLVMAAHLLIIVASVWGRMIEWAWVVYRLRGRRRVRVVRRAQTAAR